MTETLPNPASEIASSVQALAESVRAFDDKYARSNDAKEIRERASLFALILTALFTLLTLAVFYNQLKEMQKVYAPISEQAATAAQQTKILEKQGEIQAAQRQILEQQTDLMKLQYQPSFAAAIDGQVDDSRLIDVFNTGAAVRNFRPRMFSTLQVEFWLPINNKRETAYIGLVEGDSYAGTARTDVTAQLRSAFSQKFITKVAALVDDIRHRKLDKTKWQIEHVEEADWVFVVYNTRDSNEDRSVSLEVSLRSRISNASIIAPKALLEATYYDGYIEDEEHKTRFSQMLIFPYGLFGSDDAAAAQFVVDYLIESHECATLHTIGSQNDTMNSINRSAEAPRMGQDITEQVSHLMQPANCKRLNPVLRRDPKENKYVPEFPR